MATRQGAKVYKVSPTTIGKRPIYMYFRHYEGKCFPIRSMFDLGSTSFEIFPEAAKPFRIPVAKIVI